MKKFEKYTLQELQQQLGITKQTRQHGRVGKVAMTEEEEKRRLYNNLSSRVTREKKRQLIRDRQLTYRKILEGNRALDRIEDKYGISQRDERIYKECFSSGYIGVPVERSYVKGRTGLNNKQIAVLQRRTGLIPNPVVTNMEEKADESICLFS